MSRNIEQTSNEGLQSNEEIMGYDKQLVYT